MNDSVLHMLKEAVNAQRQLEAENMTLRDENAVLNRKMDDLVSFVRTQDHIASLKLREREVLLRELTEQVNELRAQLKKDRKLFADMDAAARCSPPVSIVSRNRQGSRPDGVNPKRVVSIYQTIVYGFFLY